MEPKTDQPTKLFNQFSENLFREDRAIWFEFEGIINTLQRRMGITREDAQEIICRILLFDPHKANSPVQNTIA